MANHVELKFSEIDSMVSKLSMINSNYLDTAYRQLKQSTDLGSSIMQVTWSFGSKNEIFNAVKSAEKTIKSIESTNNRLEKVLRHVKSTYESDAASAANSNNASWFNWDLIKRGILIYGIWNPTILPSFITYWAGKKIISSITSGRQNYHLTIKDITTASLISSATTIGIGKIISTKIKPGNNSMSDGVDIAGYANSQIGSRGKEAADKIISQTQPVSSPSVGLSSAEYSSLEAAMAKYSSTPYVWGGSSTNGIDCSGLVMQAYKDAGIKTDFTHNAAAMYTQCTPVGSYTKGNVDLSALQKGDLVFYSDGGTDAIKHVGIYVGDGMVTSALNPSLGVATKSIDYTYKKNIYVARVNK